MLLQLRFPVKFPYLAQIGKKRDDILLQVDNLGLECYNNRMTKSKKIQSSHMKNKLGMLCSCLLILSMAQDDIESKGATSKQKPIQKVNFFNKCQTRVVRPRKGRLRPSSDQARTVNISVNVNESVNGPTSQSEESQSRLSILKQSGGRRARPCFACIYNKRFSSVQKWSVKRNRVTNNAYKQAFFMFKTWQKQQKLSNKKQRKAKKYFMLELLRLQVESKEKQLAQFRDQFVQEANLRIRVQEQIMQDYERNAQCEQFIKVYQRAIKCFDFYVEGKFDQAIEEFYGVSSDQRMHHLLAKGLNQAKTEFRSKRRWLGLSFPDSDIFDVLN